MASAKAAALPDCAVAHRQVIIGPPVELTKSCNLDLTMEMHGMLVAEGPSAFADGSRWLERGSQGSVPVGR